MGKYIDISIGVVVCLNQVCRFWVMAGLELTNGASERFNCPHAPWGGCCQINFYFHKRCLIETSTHQCNYVSKSILIRFV